MYGFSKNAGNYFKNSTTLFRIILFTEIVHAIVKKNNININVKVNAVDLYLKVVSAEYENIYL